MVASHRKTIKLVRQPVSRIPAMKFWPAQDAKARFSELLDTCQREGPQLVSRRGTAQPQAAVAGSRSSH
jgi:prevent-host-death family protein